MDQSTSSSSDRSSAYLPFMLLLFIGSGCAALIYEVVWFQLLQLVIGSSAVSLGVLLGTFMGGMCLGSSCCRGSFDRRHHPLRVYAFLELGIGVMGLILLFGMPLVNAVYTGLGGGNIFFRGVVAGICLLPPTLMMGATLPAIARWVETTPRGVSWLGFFYGGNIAGAVVGSLVAGFYLLRVYDMAVATYAAVAINALVAVVGLTLAATAPYTPSETVGTDQSARPDDGGAARAGERLDRGLRDDRALGSDGARVRGALDALAVAAVRRDHLHVLADPGRVPVRPGHRQQSRAPRLPARRDTRAWRSAGARCCSVRRMAWAAIMLMQSLPYWPINPVDHAPTSGSTSSSTSSGVCGSCCPAPFSGERASRWRWPRWRRPGRIPGRLVGGVYAANTVGAIVGSLGTSLIITRSIGTQHGQQVLIVISADVGAADAGPGRESGSPPGRALRWVAAVGAGDCHRRGGRAGAQPCPPVPGVLVAYGRYAATWVGLTNIIYVGEGMNAFVAVSETSNGVRNYHNAGKVQASSEPQDMRLQRMLGHFTHLISEESGRMRWSSAAVPASRPARCRSGPSVKHDDDCGNRAARARRRSPSTSASTTTTSSTIRR